MARAPIETAAPSRSVPLVLRHLRARGVDADALALRAGLPRDAARREEVALTPSAFEALLALASDAVGDPLLALSLPGVIEPETFHPGELAARSSETLREALERAARYAPLFYAHLVFTCEATGEELRMRYHLRRGDRSRDVHGARFAVASTYTHAARLCARPLSPVRVWFAHPAPDPEQIEGIRRFFGTRFVGFDEADSGLAIALSEGDRPSEVHDRRMLATAERWAERALADVAAPDDTAAAVRVQLEVIEGPVSTAMVARRLGLSVRSLQRRLADQGTTFTRIQDDTRREAVVRLLVDTDLSVAEVALRAGFADAATLTRAFRRWTGRPPAAWRRENPRRT